MSAVAYQVARNSTAMSAQRIAAGGTARPILFSAAMVHEILAGQKTQTRRVVKPQPVPDGNGGASWECGSRRGWVGREEYLRMALPNDRAPCPYGQPGVRLWVRETWQAELRWDWTAPRDIPTGSPIYFEFGDEAVPACAGRKRPSIHMPRWASRLTLAVTEVRVERLSSISEADALAEGCLGKRTEDADYSARMAFQAQWEQIHGGGSWDLDPWVWVIGFKRLDGARQI